MKNKNICIKTSSQSESIAVINELNKRGAVVDENHNLVLFNYGNCIEVEDGFIYAASSSNHMEIKIDDLDNLGLIWGDKKFYSKGIITNTLAIPQWDKSKSVFISYRDEMNVMECGVGNSEAESINDLLRIENKIK